MYGSISTLLSIYRPEEIAKYIRLSEEDKNKKGGIIDESESITNQRLILNQFIDIRGNQGCLCKEFVDDGKSGTNFDRPGWKNLLDEVENGTIKVIITKNLSRLGRNNYECSYYMDCYFPDVGIRFMTVQEDVDTLDLYKSSNDYAGITNVMNEKYSRDLSKNIKNSKRVRQENGEYIGGNNTPFGYYRDPTDKHHLLINEVEAVIIRTIFEKFTELKTQGALKEYLFNNKISTPSQFRHYKIQSKIPYRWDSRTLHDILTNEVYIGHMVQHKWEKKNFRRKKLSRVPSEQWIKKENKHDAIITIEQFNWVQELLKCAPKKSKFNERELLEGMMYCHECGHALTINSKTKHKGKDGKIYKQYYLICSYYKKHKKAKVCESHSCNYFEFEKFVLEYLNRICKNYVDIIKCKSLAKEKISKIDDKKRRLGNSIESLGKEIKSIEEKIERAYMDRLDNKISIDIYKNISSKLIEDKENIEKQYNELKETYNEFMSKNSDERLIEAEEVAEEFIKSRKKVSRDLIVKLIDKIEFTKDKQILIYVKMKQLEYLN